MSFDRENLVNWDEFEAARQQLGAHFARILRYFEEDGIKSLEQIELAMRQRQSVNIVTPAHTLKGEAIQLGAETLSDVAEDIEVAARRFVEARLTPEELVPKVVELRPIFEETLSQLKNAIDPLMKRTNDGLDRRVANQKFGRF